jgi:hypothetical protein
MDAIRKENSLHTPWDLLLINRQREYNEAQQHVIFEGWEVAISNIYGGITVHNANLNISLHFFRDKVNCRVKVPMGKFEYANAIVSTISDLANATQSSPLKLK